MTTIFDDDDRDYELARRLRRAAGATPDVYVAYDAVMHRVGTVRRRRRLAATSTAAAVALVGLSSYALDLRLGGERQLTTAGPTSAEETATTEPQVTTATTIVLAPVSEGDGPTDETPDATTDTTVAPVESTDPPPPTSASVEPAVVEDVPATTAAPAPVTAAPSAPPVAPAPRTPKPVATAPAAPPETPASVEETVPPTEPPVETTAPPPVETVPPATTVPPPTTPPPSTLPPETTLPSAEPPLPPQDEPQVQPTAEGNMISVVYRNNLLAFVLVKPADGWNVVGQESINAKKVRATFQTLDGSATSVVTASVDAGKVRFTVG